MYNRRFLLKVYVSDNDIEDMSGVRHVLVFNTDIIHVITLNYFVNA